MNKKKQNTNPFRIKKVGDKYEYDFVSYSDWEKMMDTDKNKKHSFMKIIKDLVDSLRFHKKNMKQVSKNYYLYDRQKFVSRYYDRDRDIDTNYSTDIESLSSFIVQIHKYGRIVMTDDEDRDIRTNQVIEEKKLTNKQKMEKKNGLHKVSKKIRTI